MWKIPWNLYNTCLNLLPHIWGIHIWFWISFYASSLTSSFAPFPLLVFKQDNSGSSVSLVVCLLLKIPLKIFKSVCVSIKCINITHLHNSTHAQHIYSMPFLFEMYLPIKLVDNVQLKQLNNWILIQKKYCHSIRWKNNCYSQWTTLMLDIQIGCSFSVIIWK